MGERRFIIYLLLLFLHFLGTIFVVYQKTGTSFKNNVILSVFFIIIALMFLVGVLRDRPWAYQIGMLLFAALIIHNILLFYGKGMVLRLAVMLAINSVGFLLAVISLESYEERKWRMQESMPPPPKPPPKVETFEQKTVPKAEKKPARKKRKK